ncbi:MAG TPA: FAD-binding oxidoreductase [Candidatus Sulfotelmatobacter sp.]|jgi:glycolate oxidase FAD binding subunit|nr:FAD-binding oxidoreductase [Candidatus Sulfotelmatobacter sp.]
MSSVADLSTRLEKLVGGDRVRASESSLRDFAIGGRTPMAVLQPRSAEEAAEIVSFAAAEKLAVVACGSRSKLELGMPPQRYDLALGMTDLRRIAHYDPGDLTVSVDAGLPLHELARVLAEKNQFLPLAVPCSATSTVGGAIASGIDSALRRQYGTPRDFLIGAEFVDGTGKHCKSGGRVVKNVTGYDLHKLLIGSLGTLGVITRLNFRTFPLPELRRSYLASFPTLEAALNFHAALFNSGLPFSNLELFDPEFGALLAAFFDKDGGIVPESHAAGEWHVFASFEGNAAVIGRIQRELRERSDQPQPSRSETLDEQSSQQMSGALREAFDWLRSAAPSAALLRIVLPQFAAGDLTELLRLSQKLPLHSAFTLRACNIAYLALLADNEDAQTNAALERLVSELFSRVEAKKGSATLLHAPLWLKNRISLWGTRRGDFALMQRVKQAFDPHNIFAPGRFVGGI